MAQAAGETILASDIVPVRVWKKSASENRTSATMTNDADFVLIPLAANKTYSIRALYGVTATSATGDFACQYVLAGGAAQLTTKASLGPTLGTADVNNTSMLSNRANVTTSISFGVFTSGTAHAQQEFIVETTTAGTAGTITMQWANPGASGTTTLASSTVWVVQEVEMQ